MLEILIPSSVLVLRISPIMSFLRRLASSKEEQRFMLRRNDSNCRGLVRSVIVSVAGCARSAEAECWRGNCASSTLRTLLISLLQSSAL